jgi:hypothetical protein
MHMTIMYRHSIKVKMANNSASTRPLSNNCRICFPSPAPRTVPKPPKFIVEPRPRRLTIFRYRSLARSRRATEKKHISKVRPRLSRPVSPRTRKPERSPPNWPASSPPTPSSQPSTRRRGKRGASSWPAITSPPRPKRRARAAWSACAPSCAARSRCSEPLPPESFIPLSPGIQKNKYQPHAPKYKAGFSGLRSPSSCTVPKPPTFIVETRPRRLPGGLLIQILVDVLTIPDLDYQNQQLFLSKRVDDPIISRPYPP